MSSTQCATSKTPRTSIDLCDPYKRFSVDYFPNAQIVADKFHVIRLPNAALMKYRKEAERGKNTAYLRNLLLKPGYQVLDYWRPRLKEWLKRHPTLNEVYWAKERLSRFYRMRSAEQAAKELTRLTDSLALSAVPELRTLRATLKKWRIAILNFWTSRQTNARVEGGNNRNGRSPRSGQSPWRSTSEASQQGQARQTTSLRHCAALKPQPPFGTCPIARKLTTHDQRS